MLEAVMAGETNSKMMLTPGERGLPRLYRNDLSAEVPTVFWSELGVYESAMRWCTLEEGVTYPEAKIGQLLKAGQLRTLATLYFDRGGVLSQKDLKKELE